MQTQRTAWRTFDELSRDGRVVFLQEPAGLEKVLRSVSSRDQVSPKLWADDYLAAFAMEANLILVTFDRALAARVSSATLLTP